MHAILCGKSLGSGCFTKNFTERYALYVHQMAVMRSCGMSKLADDWEFAIRQYGKILQPMGACISDSPNLDKILDVAKSTQPTTDGGTCDAVAQQVLKVQMPEVQKLIASMTDAAAVKTRLYTILGFAN
jgi:hypothetical protein